VLSNTSTWTMKRDGRGRHELSQDAVPVATFTDEHTARLVTDVLNADATAETLHRLMTARATPEAAPKDKPTYRGKSHWYHGRS
jgi:hypothetical protein